MRRALGASTGLLAAVALAACTTAPEAVAPAPPRPLVLLVGDSTMAPETGYGDALCARLEPAADCLNLGRGGRSTRSYRDEGLWDRVLARVRATEPGRPVAVLLQFGHNDQPGKPGRSTDLATEFPANLARYVDELRSVGAAPVLVTPLTRRSFNEGRLVDDLGPWAESVRGVAQARGVPVVDLHARSVVAVQALGPAAADGLAQGPVGDPRFDRTHLGPRGACVFAALVLQGLHDDAPRWTAGASAGPDCRSVPPPGPDNRRSALDPHSVGHEGWAVGTMGGRGGRILRVTTLAARGPGSLHAALETPGARTVVFEVGGVIDLGGESLRIRHPFLTIAGQTAPSPGITLIRGGIDIGSHDVIVQHLRVRPGAYGRARHSGRDHDGINASAAHHVLVDHCSFSWATDENLSASGPRFAGGSQPDAWRRGTSRQITYSHNLMAESLSDSVHAKGEHSKGTLIHDNVSEVLLLGNVWISNRERNPLFKGGARGAVVNSLVFNPGSRAMHYNLWLFEWQGQVPEPGRLVVAGSVLRHGPDTRPDTPLFLLGGEGPLELELRDNLAFRSDGTAAPLSAREATGNGAELRPLPAGVSGLPALLPVLPAAELEALLPAWVGARPWDRDATDLRLLRGLLERQGRLIDDEREVGGLPATGAATRQPFDPAAWDLRTMAPRAGWASLRR